MSNDLPTNRIVQLTPPGRGAVATWLVEGPRAVPAARELLHLKSRKALTDFSADRPIFAHFGGLDGEEVVARRLPAAATRPEAIELHCHGGLAATRAIEKTFLGRGFPLLSWEEWIERSIDDSVAAAARVALAEARTERTAAILLDQYHGALSRELRESTLSLAQAEAILDRASLGRHLTKPWRVVLIGAPNVGKSSLLNALLGYGRAIVHHTPGTTRDVVRAQTAFDGWPVELLDTAGLRNAGSLDEANEHDAIELAGIKLTRRQITEADLLLLVFDAGQPWTADDEAFSRQYPQAMILHNKADLARNGEPRPKGVFVSALTGHGIDLLPRHIAKRLVPNPPPPGAAVPFTEEQLEMVKEHARLSRKED